MAKAEPYSVMGATISADERYRYRLWRGWEWGPDDMKEGYNWRGGEYGDPLSCVFIMLNPSKADARQDDPTIRRCASFARRARFFRMDIINLFAHRATNPQELLALGHGDDPVGVDNQRQVEMALSLAGLIVCAWGAHGGHLSQDETMLGWVQEANQGRAPIRCLGLTKGGFPRHPLYLSAQTALEAFCI